MNRSHTGKGKMVRRDFFLFRDCFGTKGRDTLYLRYCAEYYYVPDSTHFHIGPHEMPSH